MELSNTSHKDLNRRPKFLTVADGIVTSACHITMVTYKHANLFGEITDGVMCLSRVGEIIKSTWLGLPDYFPIHQDTWVIMPNHLHAILWLIELGSSSATREDDDPTPWHNLEEPMPDHRPQLTLSGSLNAIIQNYKVVTSRKVHQCQANGSIALEYKRSNGLPRDFATRSINHLWQRDYYCQMIDSQAELDQARSYISENPHRWCEDEHNQELHLR
jgi:REP-associated tyrosine transposase